MSSSGLIYAVIVGAWAAYLVPMWLRRQDELNEARPTERFSTAIRLLSGRAGMERRYAKDLQTRSAEEDEHDPEPVTDSVDVRAFAVPPARTGHRPAAPEQPAGNRPAEQPPAERRPAEPPAQRRPAGEPQSAAARPVPRGRAEAEARARRSRVLARRRRTTVVLFLAFTAGAVVAAVGGLAFLWAPAVPAALLTAYIVHLRRQEQRRFAYTMDRRRAEVAARQLRDRRPRRRPAAPAADEAEEGPEPESDTQLAALAADRRALVEQTDHAEWVDQQRERRQSPGTGASWEPVPVPLPTYVTAPVAPRAGDGIDLGAPDTWSSARSSTVGAPRPDTAEPGTASPNGPHRNGSSGTGKPESTASGADAPDAEGDRSRPEGAADPAAEERGGARRAASARRSRERGRTPLFDQYEDGERPRAANE
ncbi:gephyrin-like molybdotransferase receptor GlpR [Streptomyces sp. NPDC058045]|uniref:divisome protein SepX/GlpR n=1 Tax=Streptomyces sp. NPDC058045 TaxID=3346311 RepID=UPI0036ECE8B7